MPQLFANNAYSVLSGAINDTTTSIALSAGTGSRFPSPTGGDYFLATLVGIDSNGVENAWEIVKCTARTSDTLTVVRAQEGTTGVSWAAGTRIELRVTAAQVAAFEAAYNWGDHASAGYLTSAVTSVALSVPTGLEVSGSPITGTGTFVVTFQSGYSIPTTTKQGQWDTAYGWGNHSGLYLALAGSGNKSVSGAPYIPETTLTDGSTVTWNFATDNVEAVVTLGGNRILAVSNVPPAGTWATLRVVQGSSAAYTLAFGTGIDAGDQGTPTYSGGTSGLEDLLSFRSNGTVMQFVGKVGGYA